MPTRSINETESEESKHEQQELKIWSPFTTINFRSLFEETVRRYWTYVARFRFPNSSTGAQGINRRFWSAHSDEESNTATRKL